MIFFKSLSFFLRKISILFFTIFVFYNFLFRLIIQIFFLFNLISKNYGLYIH